MAGSIVDVRAESVDAPSARATGASGRCRSAVSSSASGGSPAAASSLSANSRVSITNGIFEFALGAGRDQGRAACPCRRPEAGEVVDQQDGGRAVLEGVGGLVAEGGVVGGLLAVERAVSSSCWGSRRMIRTALPLTSTPGVIVVVELQGVVLGGDPVAGEDDRQLSNVPLMPIASGLKSVSELGGDLFVLVSGSLKLERPCRARGGR